MSCTLFRAVTQWEYDDIQQQGNRFRSSYERSSLEVKQFAVSEKCGHYYGKVVVQQYDNVHYILVRVELNIDSFCDDVMQLDDCFSVCIYPENMNQFNEAIVECSIVNYNLN